MKWASITIAYNEEDFIGGHTQNMLDCGITNNIVMISDKPFFGKVYPHDRTAEIAKNMGCTVINGEWKMDDPMLNCGMYFLKNYDVVLFTAPDEFVTIEDFKKMDKFIESTYDKGEAWANRNMNTYFKTYYHRIEPKESARLDYCYRPIIAINPKLAKWKDIRACTGRVLEFPEDIILWHFAYYRTDEAVRRKMEINSNADIVEENWYDNVWKKWTPEMRNFHVEFPEQFESVVEDIPPQEILKYLKDHSLYRGN